MKSKKKITSKDKAWMQGFAFAARLASEIKHPFDGYRIVRAAGFRKEKLIEHEVLPEDLELIYRSPDLK